MEASKRKEKIAREKRAYVIRNLYLSKLCRKLLDTLVDVLAHAANLNSWAVSYDLYSKYNIKGKPTPRFSRAERFKAFAEQYQKILVVIDEASMLLDDNKFMGGLEDKKTTL